VGARAAFLATLVLACTAADGLAVESLRPTGQVDQATAVVGPLRRQLLSGTANGNGADPAHPIVIRSALTLGTGSTRVRALLVTFRSRSGRQCVDVVFRAPGVEVTPLSCLPPCPSSICFTAYSRGSIPDGVRVLFGSARPGITEIRVTAGGAPERRYRVSRSRIGSPARAPILVDVRAVPVIRAFAKGEQVAVVRFRS
jgi:hypothetical protein